MLKKNTLYTILDFLQVFSFFKEDFDIVVHNLRLQDRQFQKLRLKKPTQVGYNVLKFRKKSDQVEYFIRNCGVLNVDISIN